MQIDKDLVAASSTPLVLAILAEGESYGYAILKRVRDVSDGDFEWTDGMLYPLLHRLHRLGYVTREWRTPDEGRRRRYYAITDEGRAALEEHKRQWMAVARVLGDVWGSDDLLRRAVVTAPRRPGATAGAHGRPWAKNVKQALRRAWSSDLLVPNALGRA